MYKSARLFTEVQIGLGVRAGCERVRGSAGPAGARPVTFRRIHIPEFLILILVPLFYGIFLRAFG